MRDFPGGSVANTLPYMATGSNNTGVGFSALYSYTTGYDNTASGYEALYSNTTGYENTASGYHALYYATGRNNIGEGSTNQSGRHEALKCLTPAFWAARRRSSSKVASGSAALRASSRYEAS